MIDDIITRNGKDWRITAVTSQFIIATRADLKGEPETAADIIKIDRRNNDVKK